MLSSAMSSQITTCRAWLHHNEALTGKIWCYKKTLIYPMKVKLLLKAVVVSALACR